MDPTEVDSLSIAGRRDSVPRAPKHVRISDYFQASETNQAHNYAGSINSCSMMQDGEPFDDISLAIEETNLDILPNTGSDLSRGILRPGQLSSQRGQYCTSKRSSRVGMVRKQEHSMADHVETIRSLWLAHSKLHFKRKDDAMTDELPAKLILSYLVKEGVALDRDKAKAAVESEIGPLGADKMISFGEFQSIFVRGIFKQAIENRAEAFKGHMNSKKGRADDLNLR